jgi:Leucine-rich repeat (LRR) protein
LGKLKRLRKLVLNGNRIKSLPAEVGRLEMLEELILSENSLDEIPSTIATMAMLRVLKIQNNDLKVIPNELVDVVTLEELDFSGNPNLKMVPKLWQGDTESVLFVCRIHRDYQWQMSELNIANNDLTKHSQYLEQEQLLMKVSIEVSLFHHFVRNKSES